jgi:hypothetical protein
MFVVGEVLFPGQAPSAYVMKNVARSVINEIVPAIEAASLKPPGEALQ